MGGAARNQNVFDATVNSNYVLPGGTCLAVGTGRSRPRRRRRLQHPLGGAHLRSPGRVTDRHRRRTCSAHRRQQSFRPVLGVPRRRRRKLWDQHPVHLPPRADPARQTSRSTASTGVGPTPRRRCSVRSIACWRRRRPRSTRSPRRRPCRWPGREQARRDHRVLARSVHRPAGGARGPCAAADRRRRTTRQDPADHVQVLGHAADVREHRGRAPRLRRPLPLLEQAAPGSRRRQGRGPARRTARAGTRRRTARCGRSAGLEGRSSTPSVRATRPTCTGTC